MLHVYLGTCFTASPLRQWVSAPACRQVATAAQEVRRLVGPAAPALEWLGLWHPPGSPPTGFKALRGATVLLIDLLLFVFCSLLLLLDPPADAEGQRETFFYIMASFTWTVRGVFFMLERTRHEKLVSILLSLRQRFPDDGCDIRGTHLKNAALLSLAWQVAPVLVLPAWIIEPMLETHYVTYGNITEVYRRTMLYMWTPGDMQQSPNYEISYVSQVVVSLIAVEASVLQDIFFVNIMVQVTSELDVLNANISSMRLPAAAKSQSVANGPEYSDTKLEQYEATYFSHKSKTSAEDELQRSVTIYKNTNDENEELYKKLVKNVRHHQMIMVCIDELEAAMSKSIAVVLVISTLNICVHAFGFVGMFQEDAPRVTVFKRTVAFVIYMTHNALFCFLGQSITDQSERLLHSTFSCGWADADRPFKRSLMIVMRQTSRPLVINVGKFFTLSRNTYMQIVNTSYTIFNMLLSVQ
uniref:Odorant receptor n=1 Tax=Locusta migratoria TaxID=7004 RepID=A0A0M4IUD7_LOCMI|nr:odorant receptor 104 [Locusta migratoria]